MTPAEAPHRLQRAVVKIFSPFYGAEVVGLALILAMMLEYSRPQRSPNLCVEMRINY